MSYAENLYEKVAIKLKESGSADRHDLLANTNFLLLYLDKNDGSESTIHERFGTETLVAPIKSPNIEEGSLATGNQRRRAVNELIREGRRAVRHAQELLSVIAEEVTNRENKTCLLLPPRNFGGEFEMVLDCIRKASSAGEGKEEFRNSLRGVSRSLRTVRAGRHEYFLGKRQLVFRSPGKAGARHGLAPGWEDAGHDLSCVIRGRVRFGTSYDPKFHYDCDIPKDGSRRFPSCHGTRNVPRGRTHVNIAPNDNIR